MNRPPSSDAGCPARPSVERHLDRSRGPALAVLE